MKTRFLFPNRFKKYGIAISLPLLFLGFLILFRDLSFEALEVKLPAYFPIINENINTSNVHLQETINLTDELVTIGLIAGLLLIAFSKTRIEDEYVQQVRLESLQWGVYSNYILLILANLFIHGLSYLHVLVINIFTPLLIFIIRFHYILFIKPAKEIRTTL